LGLSLDGPAADQIEITFIGPGYGECCLIHLGSSHWVIIDSCIDASGRPAALEYLTCTGIDPPTSVRLIIATHWHDDHIAGLAETLRFCRSARFCCSAALSRSEFLANIAPYNERANFSGGSGVSELFEIMDEFKVAKRPRPARALASRVIEQFEASRFAHLTDCEIWTLSPSDAQFEVALRDIGRLVPEINKTKRRMPSQRPNHLAVVTLIKIGSIGALFGADLEETANPEAGWSAIVNSTSRPQIRCRVFKVPHHGSVNGHSDDVWTQMLDVKPIAVATPFDAGRKPLPTSEDIARISTFAGEFYLTSSSPSKASRKRAPAVEKTIREVGKLTSVASPAGIVRLRNGGLRSPNQWTAELSGQAHKAA
jgi:phosphoribosyl 1,2-cyclic phosphodiesterase